MVYARHGTKVNAAAVFRRQRLLSPAARLGPRGWPRSFERLRPVPYEPRVAHWGDTRINRFPHHPWGTIIDSFFFVSGIPCRPIPLCHAIKMDRKTAFYYQNFKYVWENLFALRIFSMFGSTYLWECSFSKMRAITTEQRTRLSDSPLSTLIRTTSTSLPVDILDMPSTSKRARKLSFPKRIYNFDSKTRFSYPFLSRDTVE